MLVLSSIGSFLIFEYIPWTIRVLKDIKVGNCSLFARVIGGMISSLPTHCTCLFPTNAQVEFVEGDDEDMSDIEDYEGEYEFDGGEDMEEDEGTALHV